MKYSENFTDLICKRPLLGEIKDQFTDPSTLTKFLGYSQARMLGFDVWDDNETIVFDGLCTRFEVDKTNPTTLLFTLSHYFCDCWFMFTAEEFDELCFEVRELIEHHVPVVDWDIAQVHSFLALIEYDERFEDLISDYYEVFDDYSQLLCFLDDCIYRIDNLFGSFCSLSPNFARMASMCNDLHTFFELL